MKINEMGGYLYVLQSDRNGRYYVGSTNDLDRRFGEHNRGEEKATKYLVPLQLVYKECFESLLEARRREREIKKWKSKKMIKQLILGP